jgi:hypothetical protein
MGYGMVFGRRGGLRAAREVAIAGRSGDGYQERDTAQHAKAPPAEQPDRGIREHAKAKKFEELFADESSDEFAGQNAVALMKAPPPARAAQPAVAPDPAPV